ncbi:MAG: hypothetical protein KDJ36_00920 [Hyphomicrobiaceae bacterium]|nr:hypothetical protein [Hyphomicrobiaceae bacterium]
MLGSTPSFWLGRRGQVVPFLAFPLLTCPEVSATTYILARKTASGKIEALAVGRVEHAASSLNLAALRHHAASIGAQYVHVLIRPADARQRRRIERDLKTSATAIQPASNDD